MASPTVPKDGLTLYRTSDSTPAPVPLQVMRLSLAQKITDDILKSLQNKEKVTIHFGKRVTVQHGKKPYRLSSVPETVPSEIYRRSSDSPRTYYFSGKLSHRLEAEKAQQDTAKTERALATLTQSLKSDQEQKESNEAKIITDKNELRKLNEAAQNPKTYPPPSRKDRLLGRAPPSPLGAGRSPASGPTAARSVPSINKDQLRLNAIKIPMLHLLAVKPLNCQTLAQTLRATVEDCKKVLQKLSKDGSEGVGLHELKDTAYRELDPHNFGYPSESDRERAVERARSAFDRKRISPTDLIWENLLPIVKRGKNLGSTLSKLKLSQPTPLSIKRAIDDKAFSGPEDARQNPSKKAKTGKTAQRMDRTDSSAVSKSVKASAAKGVASKDKKKAVPSKFKSAERIEDSDDELEDTIVTGKMEPKANLPTGGNAASSDPKLSTSNKSKPASAHSSSLKPNTALRGVKKASPSGSGKSPSKPSPLGSSPPTNATDLDDSQPSHASSSQTSILLDRSLKPARTADSKAGNLKRKGADLPSTGSKRQHSNVNGVHVSRPVTNGTGKHPPTNNGHSSDSSLAGPRSRAPSSASASDSASTATTNASSKSANSKRVDMQVKRRRFQEAYTAYQKFHLRVVAIPEGDRDQADVKKLTRMHDRINELKNEIWKDHHAREGVNGTRVLGRAKG